MEYHPRHCHHAHHHRHKRNVSLNLWQERNSVHVYEYTPFKRTISRDPEEMYFRPPSERKPSIEAPTERPATVDGSGLINHETQEQYTQRLKNTPSAKHWEKLGIRNHIGVCAPVFSLKSEKNGSCGVGEYLDLLPLIDWCSEHGLDVVQLLPINDTNPFDNSPFSPISSFSLNPKLLSLKRLPNYEKQTDKMKEYIKVLDGLNSSPRVKWDQVIELKRLWLWEYFSQEDQKKTSESSEFKDYVEKNRSWLEGYGLFCFLKNKHEWKHWDEWEETAELPEDFDPNQTSIFDLPFAKRILEDADNKNEVTQHMFLQYLCYQQMRQVKEHAESKKVFIKGDIPFLVSSDSVDVWLNRKLFNLELTAGAPPDMFSEDGQNWGVPIYNWDAVRKDQYRWWKQRLATSNQFFHLFRIDHVVGFFRVWAIPKGEKGSSGHFEPSEPEKYLAQGEEVMRMLLDNCDMLAIGEDLGTVPATVRQTLQKLGICGTKVVRWERKWEEDDQPFIPFADYNVDSMTTVSTHDSQTLQQWWSTQDAEVDAFCKATNTQNKTADQKEMTPEQREQSLIECNKTPSLFHIHLLPEYLALEPTLIHADPMLERINIPGQVSDANWSYRMEKSIEQVAASQSLSSKMDKLGLKALQKQ